MPIVMCVDFWSTYWPLCNMGTCLITWAYYCQLNIQHTNAKCHLWNIPQPNKGKPKDVNMQPLGNTGILREILPKSLSDTVVYPWELRSELKTPTRHTSHNLVAAAAMAMAVAPLATCHPQFLLRPPRLPSVSTASTSTSTANCSLQSSTLATHNLVSRQSRLAIPRLSLSRLNSNSPGRESVQCRAGLEALVFDCDGVILESEDLHRRAYNAAFEEFRVRCNQQSEEPLVWTPEFYDELQNQIGGGKPKMHW